jgi:hemerythrin-like metal-binding protein
LTKWRERYAYSDGVYKALPYTYVLAGLSTMLLLRSTVAVVSGLIFMAAGAIVWSLRSHLNLAFFRGNGKHLAPAFLATTSHTHRTLEISWQESYQCGHPVIDAQHQKIFGMCNELIQALSLNASKFDMEFQLAIVVDHISEHFCTEEAMLARTKNRLFASHQAHHRALLARAIRLRDQYLKDEASAKEVVGFIAHQVIANHILHEDRKWVESEKLQQAPRLMSSVSAS